MAISNLRFIFVSSKLKKVNSRIAKAIFAHEIFHFERNDERRWFKYLFHYITYWLSTTERENEEKETDKLAIRKEYAREIYEFRNQSPPNKYYFSSQEIKKFAISIDKW
jgi:hypothetical protein